MRTIQMTVIGAALVGVLSVAGATRAGAQTPGLPGAQLTPTQVRTPATTGGPITQQQNLPLTATLIGAAEVPGPGAADAVGSAAVILDPTAGIVCYALHVVNIGSPATLAHIHEGAVGVAGPVVVQLTAPTGGDSAGCVQTESGLITRLQQNPAGFYVNVHNA